MINRTVVPTRAVLHQPFNESCFLIADTALAPLCMGDDGSGSKVSYDIVIGGSGRA